MNGEQVQRRLGAGCTNTYFWRMNNNCELFSRCKLQLLIFLIMYLILSTNTYSIYVKAIVRSEEKRIKYTYLFLVREEGKDGRHSLIVPQIHSQQQQFKTNQSF